MDQQGQEKGALVASKWNHAMRAVHAALHAQ